MGLRVLLSPNGGKPNGANNADLGQVVSLLDALPPEHVVQASHQQHTGKDAARARFNTVRWRNSDKGIAE